MQDEYEETDGSGYGAAGLGLGLGGLALASPYGRRARKMMGDAVPEFMAEPLGRAARATKDKMSAAASAMTGGASDIGARHYRNALGPATRADEDAASKIAGSFADRQMGELKRDTALARAQMRAAAEILGGMKPNLNPAGRTLGNEIKDKLSKEGTLRSNSVRREIVDNAKEDIPGMRRYGTLGKNKDRTKKWNDFEHSKDFKALNKDEQELVKRIYGNTSALKDPREAMYELARAMHKYG